MKLELVNQHTQQVVYSYDMETNEISIMDQRLKQAMSEVGISIPPADCDTYKCRCIKYGDERFHEAFYTIYFPAKINKNEFHWKTTTEQ